MKHSDTIVAPATPPGQGGVAIVRLSGPAVLAIAQKILPHLTLNPRRAQFTAFYDGQDLIDQGLVLN